LGLLLNEIWHSGNARITAFLLFWQSQNYGFTGIMAFPVIFRPSGRAGQGRGPMKKGQLSLKRSDG
jgi:hypothetical protein